MAGHERPAGGEHVVHEQHARALRQVVVRLDRRGGVLEGVGDGCRGPGQLPGFADRHETDLRARRDGAGEEESARLDPGDHVEAPGERGDERIDDLAEGRGIREERGDVAEDDARLGIVGDRADQRFGACERGGIHSPTVARGDPGELLRAAPHGM